MTLLPYGASPGSDWIIGIDGAVGTAGTARIDLETQRERKAHLIVQAVTKHVWRLTFVPPGAKLPTPSPMVAEPHLQGLPLHCAKLSNGFRISAPGLSLVFEIDRSPFAFRFIDRRGEAVLAANSGDIDGLGRPFVLPFGYSASGKNVSWSAASFHLAPDEHIYGLGEKFTRLDKVHQRIVGWTVDALGSTSERSHKNAPFLWSTAGYGLFADSGARATWDIGTESCRSVTVKIEDAALDLYIIAGPEPAAILRRYADLTGHAPVPPSWSFGLWLSSGGTYRTQEEIEKLIAGIDKHRLPADVVHIDPWWMRWRRYCDFQWNREAFPDPEGLIRRILAAGLKVCLWEHPYISVESGLYALGKKLGYFLRQPEAGSASSTTAYPSPPGRTASSAGRRRVLPGTPQWQSSTSPMPGRQPGSRISTAHCCGWGWTSSRPISAKTSRRTRFFRTGLRGQQCTTSTRSSATGPFSK